MHWFKADHLRVPSTETSEVLKITPPETNNKLQTEILRDKDIIACIQNRKPNNNRLQELIAVTEEPRVTATEAGNESVHCEGMNLVQGQPHRGSLWQSP